MDDRSLNVAIIAFNRPVETAKVMSTIRRAEPQRLFIISDAARPDRPEEEAQVHECRSICESIHPSCDVTRIYATRNMGCAKRVTSGITEAFRHVDRLVILEDDCVPHTSFFQFCQSLLNHYRDDHRIATISGDNFQGDRTWGEGSYYFSKYFHCWGWATWKRAWDGFDLTMPSWRHWSDQVDLKVLHHCKEEQRFWYRTFQDVSHGKLDTWAYPFMFHCWHQRCHHVLPNVNLVSNIGFGDLATHTKQISRLANLPVQAAGEVIHPDQVQISREADENSYRRIWARKKPSRLHRLQTWLRPAA
ncbi:MAG: glycosyltransferase family 2 protein [Planctomycetota bacterium]